MLEPLQDGHDDHDDHDSRNRVDHDDKVIIPIDARTEPVGTLTTMAVEDTTQTELLNR